MRIDSFLDTAKTKANILQFVNQKGSVRLVTCRERLERDEKEFFFALLELLEEEKILVLGGRYLELATPAHTSQAKALAYGGKRPAGVQVVTETDEEKARRIAEEIHAKAQRKQEEESEVKAKADYAQKIHNVLEAITSLWTRSSSAYRRSLEIQQTKQRVNDPAAINKELAQIRRQFFKEEFKRAMPGVELTDELLNEYCPG